MQLVEQHVIDLSDPRYAVIDAAAFASKNLYNAANYEIRQVYIFERRYLSYNEMDKLMQSHEAYKALPAIAQKMDAISVLMSAVHTTSCAKVDLMLSRRQRV